MVGNKNFTAHLNIKNETAQKHLHDVFINLKIVLHRNAIRLRPISGENVANENLFLHCESNEHQDSL